MRNSSLRSVCSSTAQLVGRPMIRAAMQANASRRRRSRVMKARNMDGFTTARTKKAFYQMPWFPRDNFDRRPPAIFTKRCCDSCHVEHNLADVIACLHVRVGLGRVGERVNLVDDRQATPG